MKKALFLDRDGVINEDYGYVHDIKSFNFIPDIFDLCRVAVTRGYLIIIVTNQAGIGRGLYSEEEFLDLTLKVERIFSDNDVQISKTYYCPHHPEHGLGVYRKICNCRKPASGMFDLAKQEFGIDMRRSIMIGDKLSDLQAANASGVAGLVLMGRDEANMGAAFSYTTVPSLKDIIKMIK